MKITYKDYFNTDPEGNPSVVFEIETNSILKADEAASRKLGIDVKKCPHIRLEIERLFV